MRKLNLTVTLPRLIAAMIVQGCSAPERVVQPLNNPSAHPSYSHYYLLSPSTLFFFFCTSYCFLHILFFAHLIVFCTSYCFLHILLFCTFFYFIALLFLFFLPYVCPCVMLLYIICILIILHCPLSGPDSITFHF